MRSVPGLPPRFRGLPRGFPGGSAGAEVDLGDGVSRIPSSKAGRAGDLWESLTPESERMSPQADRHRCSAVDQVPFSPARTGSRKAAAAAWRSSSSGQGRSSSACSRSYGASHSLGGDGSACGAGWLSRNPNVCAIASRSSAAVRPSRASEMSGMSTRSFIRVFTRSRGSVYACSFSARCVGGG